MIDSTDNDIPRIKRPTSEHYLEYFYDFVANEKTPDMQMIPHSDLFYIRAALEAKFPGRLFTMDEIRTLVDQEYGIQYPKPSKKLNVK